MTHRNNPEYPHRFAVVATGLALLLWWILTPAASEFGTFILALQGSFFWSH
jgi:hypothetical protein